MDAGPLPNPPRPWRPEGCDRIGLVLQGGGALGAYQGGVYQALHEVGLEPDWVVGVSIGGINAALIAGNPIELRLDQLRSFWNRITSRPVWGHIPDGDAMRKLHNTVSSQMTTLLGQPGFFEPYQPTSWLQPRGARGATSFYDNAPLRKTLCELVDFDRLNSGDVRFAVGAVKISSGNYTFFDNARTAILPDHVMASGALPPALPMMRIGTDHYWDGGLVSNTPLQHLLENIDGHNTLIFQVDLFSARGGIPRDMMEVLGRAKDIQYSSRTRMTTDVYLRLHRQRLRIKSLLERLPEDALTDDDRVMKNELANIPAISILQLIYQQSAYEGDTKDYDFSRSSMRDHWTTGYNDTKLTLMKKDWLRMPTAEEGIVTHDIHRIHY